MNAKTALEVCTHKLDFCGMIYGAKWIEEEPFLKECKKALEEKVRYSVKYPGKDNVEEGIYLALVSGNEKKDIYLQEVPMLAEFDPDEGWKLVDRKMKDFEILAWREIPEW